MDYRATSQLPLALIAENQDWEGRFFAPFEPEVAL